MMCKYKVSRSIHSFYDQLVLTSDWSYMNNPDTHVPHLTVKSQEEVSLVYR